MLNMKSKITNALEALWTPEPARNLCNRGGREAAVNSDGIGEGIALCSAEGAFDAGAALCRELPATGDNKLLEMIPAGKFAGVDGRTWVNDDPDAIIAAFNKRGVRAPFDIEHSTHVKAPKGEPAPAVGFITKLENRGGAVFGHIDWNKPGEQLVQNKEYAYYSPAFRFDEESGRVTQLRSAGLTNTPNLTHLALNSEEEPVKLSAIIAAALGLNSEATEEQAVTAINTLKTEHTTALNREVDSTKYAPRAELDLAMNRATTAEGELKTIKQTQLNAEIDQEINKAMKDGKVVPATKEFYTAMCREEGGLAKFKSLMEKQPAIAGAAGLEGRKPGASVVAAVGENMPAGFAMNSERQDLHTRAVAYQAEHKCDYLTAVKACGG